MNTPARIPMQMVRSQSKTSYATVPFSSFLCFAKTFSLERAFSFVSHQYWAPIVFVGIILLVILIYNITKAMTDKAIEAAKVPVVEKIKELDKQLKAKTDETADYLKTYKQVTAKIVNTYPMAEPEPVENKRIPNAKPVSTRQSSDFPSARKIH